MSRNDERKTTANAVIVRLDEKMQPTAEEVTIEVPYTRVKEKAAASIREILGLDAMTSVIVKEPLVQQEYERRVYDAHLLYETARYNDLVFEVDKDGNDSHDEKKTAGFRRFVVDTYTYVMIALLQRFDGSYAAAKITAYDITECRSGIGSAQGYCKDVLDGKHVGTIEPYHFNGNKDMFVQGDFSYTRIAGWDGESKMRICKRYACYVTDEQLSTIPYTVYRRGDSEDSNK